MPPPIPAVSSLPLLAAAPLWTSAASDSLAASTPTARFCTIATDESDTRPPVFRSPPPTFAIPCSMVTPEICTLPPLTWMTRSILLPSMIVPREPEPLIAILPARSRSPVALGSVLAVSIVNL